MTINQSREDCQERSVAAVEFETLPDGTGNMRHDTTRHDTQLARQAYVPIRPKYPPSVTCFDQKSPTSIDGRVLQLFSRQIAHVLTYARQTILVLSANLPQRLQT